MFTLMELSTTTISDNDGPLTFDELVDELREHQDYVMERTYFDGSMAFVLDDAASSSMFASPRELDDWRLSYFSPARGVDHCGLGEEGPCPEIGAYHLMLEDRHLAKGYWGMDSVPWQYREVFEDFLESVRDDERDSLELLREFLDKHREEAGVAFLMPYSVSFSRSVWSEGIAYVTHEKIQELWKYMPEEELPEEELRRQVEAEIYEIEQWGRGEIYRLVVIAPGEPVWTIGEQGGYMTGDRYGVIDEDMGGLIGTPEECINSY